MMQIELLLERLLRGESLDLPTARAVLEHILAGHVPPAQIAALAVALRAKGETADELAGFAAAMRAAAIRVDAPADRPVLDTCGTGGDGSGTFNISTVVAFVVAGAGVTVAKHGNRSISSRSGSADVLEALGLRIDLSPAQMSESLAETGFAFLFAPALHPALKTVQPVRRELKIRTIFNLLGPLANPAGAPFQLIGAPSREAAAKMAQALETLGTRHAYLVHGDDGLDEVSISGPTHAYEVTPHGLRYERLTPDRFGLPTHPLEALRGGDATENAALARRILEGAPINALTAAPRDIVLANAATALVAAELASDFRDGVHRAAQSIDSGAALAKLELAAAFTQRALA